MHFFIDDEEILSLKDLEWCRQNVPTEGIPEEIEQSEELSGPPRKKPARQIRQKVSVQCLCSNQ